MPPTFAGGYYFNPRSPCGERLSVDAPEIAALGISIHAPRAGSDDVNYNRATYFMEFQSTLPVRGATNGIRTTLTAIKFQSTLPVRGATYNFLGLLC